MSEEQHQSVLRAIKLVRRIKRLIKAQRTADRLICRHLADLADGMTNCPGLLFIYGGVHEWAHRQLGLSVRAIRERIRVGRVLRGLPFLDAALMSGELSYSRVREVTRVATSQSEQVWLEAARQLSMRMLERRVRAASDSPRSPMRTPRRDARRLNPMLDLPEQVLDLLKQAMQAARAEAAQELTDAQALARVARAALAYFAGSSSGEISAAGLGTTQCGSLGSEGRSSWAVAKPGPECPRDEAPSVRTSAHAPLDSSGRVPRGGSPTRAEPPPRGGSPTRAEPPPHGGSPTRAEPLPQRGSSTHAGPLQRGSQPGGARRDVTRVGGEGNPLEPTHGESEGGAPLSDDARRLLDVIRTGGSWNIATLSQATAIPIPRLADAVFDLETQQLVMFEPREFLELPSVRLKPNPTASY